MVDKKEISTEGDTWIAGQQFMIWSIYTIGKVGFNLRKAFLLLQPLGL